MSFGRCQADTLKGVGCKNNAKWGVQIWVGDGECDMIYRGKNDPNYGMLYLCAIHFRVRQNTIKKLDKQFMKPSNSNNTANTGGN